MGWTIQHIPGRTDQRPAALVADALWAAQSKLPTHQANALGHLLGRSGDPFELTPQQAGQIRDALNAAARRIKIRDRRYLVVIRDLAKAADTAHRSGRPWRWS